MNKNYICIDFQSKIGPEESLARLRRTFPDVNWHGSDSDTQGPSLSSIATGQPRLQLFFEENQRKFCVNFATLGLSGLSLEEYKIRFVAYINEQILPMLR